MIAVRVDDPAFHQGEAIARPVNAALGATTAAIRRLELAGGTALARQLRVHDPLAVGSAVVTGAGDLGVELMIHAVVSSDTERVSASGVRRATLSTLQRAADWRIEHLALTPFGLGPGNLDVDESATIMVDVIAAHLARARFPSKVTIIVENELESEAFLARVPRVVT